MKLDSCDSVSPGAVATETSKSRPFVLHTRIVTGVGGGPEKTILNSPRYLRELGYDAACLYLYPEGDPGIEVLRKKAVEASAEFIAWADGAPIDFQLVHRLAELCRQRNVAIWHAHDYKTNVLGLLVRRRWPMKLVTTTHGWGVAGWKNQAYALVGKACLPFYDSVVTVSENLSQSARRWGVAKARTHLIFNAIETDRYCRTQSKQEARAEIQLGLTSEFLIAALGRLSAEKGFSILVDTVAELRRLGHPVVLWIGGEGPCRAALEQQIRQSNLQHAVRLLGHLNDPRTMIQAADVFVLSSTSEGLPNVVLEAMALKSAVVATRVAGVPALIEHGRHGLLIPPGDRDAMVEAISELIHNPARREQLVAGARRRVVDSFDFGKRMQAMTRLYDSLVK
jgi:glycosyltransferase involved in cell wall biosynthesis